jgi:hypothetical protein
VYKLDSFVGFIGDEQVHAQECYASIPTFLQMTMGFVEHGNTSPYIKPRISTSDVHFHV